MVGVLIAVCIYFGYNRLDEGPKKKKSKYPDFEMDLGNHDS